MSEIPLLLINGFNFDELPNVKLLYKHCKTIINKSSSDLARAKSLSWLMHDGTAKNDFMHCCNCLQIRPLLLRLRCIYSLYQTGVYTSFKSQQKSLPRTFIREIHFIFSESLATNLVKIAQYLYINISTNYNNMLRDLHFMLGISIKQVIELVELSVVHNWVGVNGNLVYFIGRDPAKYSYSRYNWADDYVFGALNE